MQHECYQEETIGKIKEFIDSMKKLNPILISMATAIILQVGTFAFLWGGLTTTVNKNTDYLWNNISPAVMENTRNIDRILTKIDSIKMIAITDSKILK